MIYSLKGLISHIEPGIAIIECNDIGFRCYVSDNTANNLKIGEINFLYTYMNLKEDAVSLFGFINQDELLCFKSLINISGVGPKAAMSILSNFTPERLTMAISTNDYKIINKCQGIGPKTAQRIVLELKDKLELNSSSESIFIKNNSENNNFNNLNLSEAIEALKSLGYSESDILKTIKKYDIALSTEEIIKKALQDL